MKKQVAGVFAYLLRNKRILSFILLCFSLQLSVANTSVYSSKSFDEQRANHFNTSLQDQRTQTKPNTFLSACNQDEIHTIEYIVEIEEEPSSDKKSQLLANVYYHINSFILLSKDTITGLSNNCFLNKAIISHDREISFRNIRI